MKITSYIGLAPNTSDLINGAIEFTEDKKLYHRCFIDMFGNVSGFGADDVDSKFIEKEVLPNLYEYDNKLLEQGRAPSLADNKYCKQFKEYELKDGENKWNLFAILKAITDVRSEVVTTNKDKYIEMYDRQIDMAKKKLAELEDKKDKKLAEFANIKQFSNPVSDLPADIDEFLHDMAQWSGLISYNDIYEFSKRATPVDIKLIRTYKRKFDPEGSESYMKDIANKLLAIIKPNTKNNSKPHQYAYTKQFSKLSLEDYAKKLDLVPIENVKDQLDPYNYYFFIAKRPEDGAVKLYDDFVLPNRFVPDIDVGGTYVKVDSGIPYRNASTIESRRKAYKDFIKDYPELSII